MAPSVNSVNSLYVSVHGSGEVQHLERGLESCNDNSAGLTTLCSRQCSDLI